MRRTVAIMLCISLLAAALVGCGKKEESSEWDLLFLGEYLPEPKMTVDEVVIDEEESLYLELCEVTKKDYREYVSTCKEYGFNVDGENSEDSFSAFNEDGYKLYLSFWENEEKLDIQLDAPVEMAEFLWPTTGVAKSIPVPKSNVGKIEYDDSDWFCVYVGETSKKEFSAYVEACLKAGFDVDYSRDEIYFYADNDEGISLTVEYEGFNIMRIDVEGSVEEEPETTQPTESKEEQPTEPTKPTETDPETTEKPTEAVPETTEKPKDKDDGKLGKEFKEAMDAYEEFFDEYVAFMKEYKKNPTDLKLLGRYATIMTEYAQMMEEMEDWEDEDLNTAETIYYVEVTQRISKKLLEVAL